ncbi:PHP domain-containing protein [Pedobacter gandavensis]|uniref:PHP domain-containing protein n=1 Tax=Pedobacter gandavensis TaxID=2679963 RepID=UPI00292DFD07|nr:PHP domain-containing protein [Pedobacter gandavensis]
MKKIDLHIHTVSSISDYEFEFCLEQLKKYVSKLEIDCIAITNHNLFDLEQFKLISSELNIKVLAGIEINLEGGHLLLISENSELVDFDAKCREVQMLIKNKHDSITVENLITIFPDLSRYLLIPHYDKNPNISDTTLAKLQPHIHAGEVTSTKKFISCIKDVDRLTPVIFSDVRISSNMQSFPTRQTFVDLQEVTLRGIKACLCDKTKVCLSKLDGNNYFQVTEDGLFLSTGLNVMLGERSTGKTHTLNRICESFDNVKYIKQFALQQDDEDKFEKLLSSRHSTVNEQFLSEFKDVISDIKSIDIKGNRLEVEKYLTSLIKFAAESDKLDSFSKANLFSETLFPESDLKNLEKLIEATILLIDNNEYHDIISKHLEEENLKKLAVELINKYIEINEQNLKKRWLNDLITKVKEDLRLKTSTTPPNEIDFYNIILENEKIKRFNNVAIEIQKDREIEKKQIRGFKIVARTKKFTGAQQMKTKSRKLLAFAVPFSKYSNPYGFLNSLKEIQLEETEFYKYFVDIEYKTLNKHNFQVSGGERSEFNLLYEIGDAMQYDILLIDEPESSFDNLFLKNDVNELLKEISQEIPVVIVTHNSTVGASIKPDNIIYTKKSIIAKEVKYQIFCGYPSDKKLKCIDGDEIDNYDILLSCLEAGKDAYNDRMTTTYDILKN